MSEMDRWDAEANEICGAIGFNVGRTMISCALRMAYREGAREVESLKNDRDSAVRSLSEAIHDRNKMADAADKAEAERDAALRAVAGLIRWANSDGAGGGYPPVELTPAVIEAAGKFGGK